MPLFYQQDINPSTKLAIWKIDESENFSLEKIPLQREITHPHKRLQHLAGRYLLKHLFPDFPYDEILIADTRKPYLPYEQYHFSISHCGDYAAAIVSKENRVGIDIEIPTSKVLKIAHKFLSEKEREKFESSVELTTLLWCCKETMYKWWGWGEVDFSKMLQLDYFEFKKSGSMSSLFVRNEINQALELKYKMFPNLCMAYVVS
jgi:phosphopantetheinyl transferase